MNTSTQNVLAMISARSNQFGKSEKIVARMLTTSPETYSGVGLAEIADAAQVSQPTVIRFCRKLGFTGFSDFKLAFARGLATTSPALHEDVDPEDGPATIVHKVVDSALRAISLVRDGLDPAIVAKAADAIAAANRIECFANGAAYAVAVEVHNKIYRLGVPSSVVSDFYTQTILAGTLGPNDVIFIISFSGEAHQHLGLVNEAKKAGCTVIALTRPDSSLAKAASIAIGVDVSEDFISFTPISTPVAFMVAADAVAMCAAQLRPKEASVKHAAGKASLARHTLLN